MTTSSLKHRKFVMMGTIFRMQFIAWPQFDKAVGDIFARGKTIP